MKTRDLDSWAILEWISGRQPASDRARKLLAEAEAGHARLLMSAISVGEVLLPPEASQRDARRIVA